MDLVCSECGRRAEDDVAGWRAYRDDLSKEGHVPSLALFCPPCAAREFDGAGLRPNEQPNTRHQRDR